MVNKSRRREKAVVECAHMFQKTSASPQEGSELCFLGYVDALDYSFSTALNQSERQSEFLDPSAPGLKAKEG